MSENQDSLDTIKRIGVLGAGQMGAAAAVMFQRAGYEVTLWARREEALKDVETTLASVDAFLDEHFGPSSVPRGSLQCTTNLDAVDASADAMLECIAEDMAQKHAFLRRLTKARERGALVMTCTSALSITDLASGSGTEGVLVGAHFWNPPHLVPVVEIIGGKDTPPEQVERAMQLMKRLGKIPVRCADVPGFIGNRLQHALWREALAMVDAGVCSAQDIDQVVKWTFALRLPALGPMENMDLVGLNLVESVERYLFPHLANNATPAEALTSRLRDGASGMKAGRGFYDWTQRDAAETVALRDRQIVRQLQFLREQGVFDSPEKPGA